MKIIDQILAAIAEKVYRWPILFIVPQIILALLCIWYTASELKFDSNRNNLVNNSSAERQLYLTYMEEFDVQDELIVVVESEDPLKNRQFVERLGKKLEAQTSIFKSVFYKGDLNTMGPKALLFLDEEQLKQTALRLEEAKPLLEQISSINSLEDILLLVITNLQKGASFSTEEVERFLEATPTLTRIINEATEAIIRSGVPPAPALQALFEAGSKGEQQLYLTLENNQIYLVTARAISPEKNEEAVNTLQRLVEQTRHEVPGVNVGITGEPVLEVAEMEQAKTDMRYATVISLIGCMLLFAIAYKEIKRPLKVTFSLIVGLCYTLGFTTLTIGHLNILTLTFLPILIGLAIDFGIHLITRYEEELRHHHSMYLAIRNTIVKTGKGVIVGTITLAGAFLAMGFTDFKGIREMGIICGAGLILTLISMFTFLPALIKLSSLKAERDSLPPSDKRGKIENLWLKKPNIFILVAIIVTGGAIYFLPNVRFDYNLLNLQSKNLPPVIYEHKLMQVNDKSVLFGAVIANSIEEAAALEKQIKNLQSVAHVESIASILLEDHSSKAHWINRICSIARSIPLPPDPKPINVNQLHNAIRRLDAYLGLTVRVVSSETNFLSHIEQLKQLHKAVQRLRQTIACSDNLLVASKLTSYQEQLFQDLRNLLIGLANQEIASRLMPEDIPAPLRYRFISRSGQHYLLMVNSKLNLWEKEHQEIFIQELKSVSEKVTGTPLQLYLYTTQLKESYETAAKYAAGVIFLISLLHFKNIISTLFAFLPVVLGMIWLGGLMGASDLAFNPANVMTLPLLIGVGISYGIHIMHRCREEKRPCIFSKSTGKAVLVSGLTTILGFGSLMIAKHQGISSLGKVMVVGTSACMIVALVIVPALITYLNQLGINLYRLLGLRDDKYMSKQIQTITESHVSPQKAS